jgi:hypothetical protein
VRLVTLRIGFPACTLRTKKAPFAAPRKFPKARWVKPEVLIDAEFRGKTGADVRSGSILLKKCGSRWRDIEPSGGRRGQWLN